MARGVACMGILMNTDRLFVTSLCPWAPAEGSKDTSRYLALLVVGLLDHPDVRVGTQAYFAHDWKVGATLQSFGSSCRLGPCGP